MILQNTKYINKIINTMNYKKKINIYEMFMRDGLQSLSKSYTLNDKIYFYNEISKCKFKNIEFGSTTNPRILPQMEDSYLLWDYIKDTNKKNKNLTMLITDKKSLIKSLEEGITSFGLLSSVSDSFSMSNLKKNASTSFEEIIQQFDFIYNYNYDLNENRKYHVRLYLSCAFGSYKEPLDINYINNLYNICLKIYDRIIFYKLDYTKIDIVLCDTMGILNKDIIHAILKEITKIKDIDRYISLHLHTNNNFYKFIDIALSYKIYKFDSSILNIGGCPFSGKENIGNINTLSLAKYLEENNYDTGIDIFKLEDIEKKILEKMNI